MTPPGDAAALLGDAAFGGAPGTWPLPNATAPDQLWLRAVAAGGQGRLAGARADLAALLRVVPSGPLASLAHSTRGSLLRQLGWHDLARGHDGRALLLAGADPEARADALIGLAADALGVGRFAASGALLARAGEPPVSSPVDRVAVRRAWVAAELAMATGDRETALREAERAVEYGARCRSARHRVKSELVWAAALCCAGRPGRAAAVADPALDAAGRLGLVPLQWALACLLADTGSSTRTTEELQHTRDRCAETVRRRGGSWRQR